MRFCAIFGEIAESRVIFAKRRIYPHFVFARHEVPKQSILWIATNLLRKFSQ
ncbi:hypothetical protein ACWIUD_05840 [Helicobacter sp. 23-1044]